MSEAENWKKKFLEVNREFHNNQEKLMMALAELDSIKSKRTVVTQVTSTHKMENTIP